MIFHVGHEETLVCKPPSTLSALRHLVLTNSVMDKLNLFLHKPFPRIRKVAWILFSIVVPACVGQLMLYLPRFLHKTLPTETAIEFVLCQVEVFVLVSRPLAIEMLATDGTHQ